MYDDILPTLAFYPLAMLSFIHHNPTMDQLERVVSASGSFVIFGNLTVENVGVFIVFALRLLCFPVLVCIILALYFIVVSLFLGSERSSSARFGGYLQERRGIGRKSSHTCVRARDKR